MANLFDIAVAKALSGGGGGGGGSSDFSTAEVTFVGATNAVMPLVFEGGEGLSAGLFTVTETRENETVAVALYKGGCYIEMAPLIPAESIAISGNIEVINEDEDVYFITGDCTITIT